MEDPTMGITGLINQDVNIESLELHVMLLFHGHKTIVRPALQWRHNEHDCVSNHRRLEGLINRLLRRRSKKTTKLRITGLCEGNSPGAGEFLSQGDSDAEDVSIWWRHQVLLKSKVHQLAPYVVFLLNRLTGKTKISIPYELLGDGCIMPLFNWHLSTIFKERQNFSALLPKFKNYVPRHLR